MFTEEELKNEEWRDLPLEGYEQFQVSNLGRVRNGITNHILSELKYSCKPTVSLKNNGKSQKMQIATLLAMAFIENYKADYTITLKDKTQGIKLTNLLVEKPQEREWRDIKGYEGQYQVSSDGKVRSLNYNHTSLIKELHQKTDKYGYKVVHIHTKDGNKYIPTHKLVAEAFIGESNGLTVNHIDGNKENNNYTNLEYCTIAENLQHAHRTGLFTDSYNAKGISVVLENKDGDKYRFPSMSKAGQFLGLSASRVSEVLHKRRKQVHGYTVTRRG